MTIPGGKSALITLASVGGADRLGGARPTIVEVRPSATGAWEVLIPDSTYSTTCETLSAARRIGRRWAQDNPPSELIIRDAYDRVILRRSFRDTSAVG
jgi:hypothetical protein